MNTLKTLKTFLDEIEKTTNLEGKICILKWKEYTLKWKRIIKKLCKDDYVECYRNLNHLKITLLWLKNNCCSQKKTILIFANL